MEMKFTIERRQGEIYYGAFACNRRGLFVYEAFGCEISLCMS